MTQVLIAVAVAVVAVAVAAVLQRRRRPDAPSQPRQWSVPAQLDRADFADPAIPWLVVVFTSSTCGTCGDVVAKARVLACEGVAVQEVEAVAHADLQRRYHIDAVPLTVLADGHGVVQASFLGPVTATDLWAAVAEARSPGTSPEPGLGRPPG